MATSDDYRWQNIRERVGLPLEPPVVERCAYCAFEIRASLERAREAFAGHVCDRPRVTVSKRRRRGF